MTRQGTEESDAAHLQSQTNGSRALPVPEDLVEECFAELHVIARRLMRHESPGHTLQPTALVAELWIKLANGTQPSNQSRAAFLGRAAVAMRRILVSHARGRTADKRGGDRTRVPLDDSACLDPAWQAPQKWLEFDEELKSIESANPQAVRIFEMRFLGGMQYTEIADLVGISASHAGKEGRFVARLLGARMTELGLEDVDDARDVDETNDDGRDCAEPANAGNCTHETDADTATGRATP